MCKILLFAGTTEGRLMAEFLEEHQIPSDVCVATEYGEQVLDQSFVNRGSLQIHRGRLTMQQMEEMIRANQSDPVIDATHPYAAVVSENIRLACKAAGSRYLRLIRTPETVEGDCVFVSSVQEAVDYLKGTTGKILAATGSKELEKYTAIENYQERVVARVLSTQESVESCVKLGFQGKNLICMQGPFDEELNYAMLRQTKAAYLVTKESGKTGGFPEKVSAARRAGAKLVVIGRPSVEEGDTLDQMQQRILAMYQKDKDSFMAEPTEPLIQEEPKTPQEKRQIAFVGIGMGRPDQMTMEARRVCEEADVLIGAERMLGAAKDLILGGKPNHQEYIAGKIREYLDQNPQYRKAAVLLSGDIGFYSGAKKLMDAFEDWKITVHCGISSVVYLCAAAHTSWDDVKLVSLHGRNQNLMAALRHYKKVFVLVGKQDSFREMLRSLIRYGYQEASVTVGCHLSYPQEKILTGSPASLMEEEVGDLTAVLITREGENAAVTHGIEDEAFTRAKVPMTKAEIRSISLSKMRLKRDSLIYDVGAGTGSVSIECALMATEGQVYAIEKKTEAVELIRENAEKFGVSNLEVVEGLAPEALMDLPVPTHAFIGGSSGNMEEILRVLLNKNPKIRIVINAIALETVAETLECIRKLPLEDVDIASVSVGKSKEIGRYHMMMGQNPVYIISCSGKEEQGMEEL